MKQKCENCGTLNTGNSGPCTVCGEPLGAGKATKLLPETPLGSEANRLSGPVGQGPFVPTLNNLSSRLRGSHSSHKMSQDLTTDPLKPSSASYVSSISVSQRRSLPIKRWLIPLGILIGIIIMLAIVVPPIINPSSSLPSIGKDGIGVTLVDGEYIGISDGRYALDTNRPAGSFMLQASESLRNGNVGNAMAEWDAAHDKDTSDAEPLIYAENQRVLTSGSSYMTIVLGLSLGVNIYDGFSRDDLQGAYIVQKECNENPQLSGGKKLRLLIARSGSDPNRSQDIARQVVQAAQYDKTIVGVQGWTNSLTTLNVVKTLVDAHIPIVASDPASDALTGISPYFFRIGTPSKVDAPLIANYIEEKLKPHHLVILRDPHEPYSSGLYTALVNQFAQDKYNEYQDAPIEDFQTGDKDRQLTQHVKNVLSSYKPDLIYIATNTVGDITTLLNNIPTTAEYANLKVFTGGAGYELVRAGETFNGYTRILISSSAFPDEWSILGAGNPEPPFFKDYPATYDPQNQHISDHPYTYRRANAGVMMTYDALSVFLVANKNAVQQGKQNPTAEDIKNALSQINGAQSFQGITGAISFDSHGNPINKLHFVLRVVESGYLHAATYQGCFLVGSPCDNEIHILE